MLIYFSCAIDRNTSNTERHRVDELLMAIGAHAKASRLSMVVYQPNTAFMVNRPEMDIKPENLALMSSFVKQINEQALASADFVLMVHAQNTESWGMPQELTFAINHRVPVVFLTECPVEQLPLYVLAYFEEKSLFFPVHSLPEAWEVVYNKVHKQMLVFA